ncbi:MAG: polysaccharide biosynthesis protein [Anaerolineae bacterium]
MLLDDKRVLVTGGTGSLGRKVVDRLLAGEMGTPRQVTVFSRDEAKQHYMRLDYQQRSVATDEVIYRNSQQLLRFCIGDVRDYGAFLSALRRADVVIHAAALKQVPTCEYFPVEAVLTNVLGPANLVRALRENDLPVETVVGISTDKACKPINAMGMTKALQERVLLSANLDCPHVRLMCVRYGNVIASRGSVIPLFLHQIELGGPVTITLDTMTRFLLSLDRAVDTVFAALRTGEPGDTYIPKVPAARMMDLAQALIGDRDIKIALTGIRPGEKIHEIMISEEEIYRTVERDGYYVIRSILPEISGGFEGTPPLSGEYSSQDYLLNLDGIRRLLTDAGVAF